ncbi:hypothetical protein BAUCODRAFT_263047 [Baudoinia panamericana UAMH 10762]|uniref:Uncharacterized protein n=1 Tax=Baudoinia panamericana (strain UAMH 10762) TaxID=717646 RepID=M2N1I2_BAUPA|nr:uncharacterized protein BAUCODRAFT_263047 [Baudoinia panamericana UAMH 10762]EMC92809.1 hypothetical protein BAUCODRAFT_263047 [Baudoinia panamericana UAMH 10762]
MTMEHTRGNFHATMSSIGSTGGLKLQLHWSQRVALVRHNLHTASRSGVFTFFKILQAKALSDGTNHPAVLAALIGGDEADVLIAAMDNLNVGLAYVHQDAFKNVYDRWKDMTRDGETNISKSKLHVDFTMQRSMADMAIDKITTSAIGLINAQPPHVQGAAANVWIAGVSVIADAIETVLQQLQSLEDKELNDFIRLEESWDIVKGSVVCAITGLKGIFSLMDPSDPGRPSEKSSRSNSIASASGAMFRRLSTAFSSTGITPPDTHNGSITSNSPNFAAFHRNNSVSSISSSPVYRTPNYVRNSVSAGCPMSMPANEVGYQGHHLSPVPPTPAAEEATDPFGIDVPPVPPMPETIQTALNGEELHRKRLSMMIN